MSGSAKRHEGHEHGTGHGHGHDDDDHHDSGGHDSGHDDDDHGGGHGGGDGHGHDHGRGDDCGPCEPRHVVERDVYLQIESIHGYSPVEPTGHGGGPYRRDCMRNVGHEDGTIPDAEVESRRLTALIYREYLDAGYLVPKPDKLVLADVNEPIYTHRVPGTVIYTCPGERLRIHVRNADAEGHSLHVHGLAYGIDSDGSWPFGTETTDGRRSDEICPGQTWTYMFDVDTSMLGAWPFHDHAMMVGTTINRGLFGGIVVLSPEECEPPKRFELPDLVHDLIHDRVDRAPGGPVTHTPMPHHEGVHAAAGHHGGQSGHVAGYAPGAGHHAAVDAAVDYDLAAGRAFLEEYAQLAYAHPRPKPTDVLHVPLFLHFMAGSTGVPAFDSGAFPPGATPFAVPFGGEASFDYHCERHQSMQGKVVVAAGEAATTDVFIVDAAGPMTFNPVEARVAPGGTVRWHPGTVEHTVTENGGGISSYCLNGRSFVGNTPTIVGHTGQRVRWYVFNLDIGMMWHNFHTHGQRWRWAGEHVDTRSIGPAESFVAETTVPPVLLLPLDIEATQPEECRPKGAEPYDLSGDFLFHCHVEMHMMAGLTGLVRANQRVWLTKEQHARLAGERGLPLANTANTCPDVDHHRCEAATCGRWEAVAGSPEVCQMHMMLLPGTTKVLYWGYGDTRDDVTRLWDYATTPGVYSAPANQPFDVTVPVHNRGLANIWSAEHAYQADGTPLVHGGFTPRSAFRFDRATLTWSRTSPTAQDRFYSTTLTLADGRILTLFGSASRTIEVYDPGPGIWSPPKALPPAFTYVYYPWTYLLPGGDLFIAGPTGESRRFDWTANPVPAGTMWPTIAGNRSTGGEKGTSVLLPLRPPLYEPRVVIAGGNTAAGAQTSELIDLSAASPAWTSLPNLNVARPEQVNTVLLPDGRVLLAGGVNGADGGPAEVLDAADPAAGWLPCASMTTTRGYHSAAILLADGSVLMGGDRVGQWKSGETTPSERYFPWYFGVTRPTITGAPAAVAYGATFTVQTPAPGTITEVVLIRPGAVTHGFNMSQRFVGCTITGTGAGSVEAAAPPDGTVAPPGPYLLFLVAAGRVPSLARWVMLG